MNDLMLVYEGKEVRTQEANGEIWWVAKDVCEILGLDNVSRAIEKVEGDDVTQSNVIDSLGRAQQTYMVNESGLYSLILKSEKPEAKKFKHWVTKEVLPSIRKTGGYGIKPVGTLDFLQLSLDLMKKQEAKLLEHDVKLEQLEISLDSKVKQALKREQVNEFPIGCINLEGIRTKYYKDMSICVVSKWLYHIKHPTREYKKLLDENVVRIVLVYEDKGLNDTFIRLIQESDFQKETKKNKQYFHPALGNYRIKSEK